MAIQTNVATKIVYGAESTLGTPPATNSGKILRRNTSNLAIAKDTFASAEVRTDFQVADMRHGMQSVRGSIEAELSLQSFDSLIEAAMGGTWATGVSCSPSDFATGVTVATSGGYSTLTFAGAGSLITKGFNVGDIVRLAGFTTSANNAKNLRITTLTATVMTVYPAITAASQQASGWSVTVPGKKLLMGTTKRSFTFEHVFDDIDVSELFKGCRVNGMSIRAQPNQPIGITFDILGQSGIVNGAADSPYFVSPTAAPTTSVVAGLNGGVRVGSQELAIVTGLDLNLTNSMSVAGVVGAAISPEVFQGRKLVTGNVSLFLQDEAQIAAFLNETELDIATMFNTSTGTPQDFISLNIQRAKFTSCSHQIAADGGVIAQFAWQGLVSSTSTDDLSTMVMQRSNAS